jgi:ATP-dependent helicase HrpB
MVVFCTNIAETSITIPGVTLVIDSGYSKESEYDPEKRINILSLKRISKSSAD